MVVDLPDAHPAVVEVAHVHPAIMCPTGCPVEGQSVNASLGTTNRLTAATRAVIEQTAHTVR